MIYHNNFISNAIQVHVYTNGYADVWDNGYPSGENYCCDYNGTDSNQDSIGDTPYIIDANNRDRYPLMRATYSLSTDLNKDGSVNILDIFIIAKAFGSKPGDANWNAIADLNKDNIVKILDVFAVAWDFGKTT